MFKCMFPDSAIPAKFTLGKDNVRYMVIYGLFPAFKRKLKTMINTSSWISVSFDESHNVHQQKCQMDVNVRYWNDKTNCAETSYFNSKFLLRPNATNLTNAVLESIDGLDQSKFLHLSMDGPTTNWNVLQMVDDHLVESGYRKTINIGSCSLHIVHGAFQTGAIKTEWEINKTLKAMFKIFDKSPARRDVYLKEGSSSEFPMKFCQTRWIEDGVVAERALEVWDSVVNNQILGRSVCIEKTQK